MIKKNRYFLILLIFLSLFFSGCVSISVNQELTDEGNSDITITYDFSAMIKQMNEMAAQFNSTPSENEDVPTCEGFENLSEKTGFNCNMAEEGILILTGNWQSGGEYFNVKKSFTKTTYEYDAIEVFDILNALSEDEDEKIEKESLSQMKMLNPKLKYELTMPAKITSAEVGDINENKVKIDIFDLEDLETAKIVATKTNNMFYYVVGAGIILLIIVGIVFIKKKKSNAKMNVNGAQQSNTSTSFEEKCKGYVLKYKKQYSKEAIKKSLLNSNMPENIVDDVLNKYY
ncbi:MAG: hypothetical protein ACOCXG_04075 [Nanoarchaeota archaeon]